MEHKHSWLPSTVKNDKYIGEKGCYCFSDSILDYKFQEGGQYMVIWKWLITPSKYFLKNQMKDKYLLYIWCTAQIYLHT